MSKMYTIRNLNDQTKEVINRYASDHNLTVPEALQELVQFGLEYLEKNPPKNKPYKTLSEALKEVA